MLGMAPPCPNEDYHSYKRILKYCFQMFSRKLASLQRFAVRMVGHRFIRINDFR